MVSSVSSRCTFDDVTPIQQHRSTCQQYCHPTRAATKRTPPALPKPLPPPHTQLCISCSACTVHSACAVRACTLGVRTSSCWPMEERENFRSITLCGFLVASSCCLSAITRIFARDANCALSSTDRTLSLVRRGRPSRVRVCHGGTVGKGTPEKRGRATNPYTCARRKRGGQSERCRPKERARERDAGGFKTYHDNLSSWSLRLPSRRRVGIRCPHPIQTATPSRACISFSFCTTIVARNDTHVHSTIYDAIFPEQNVEQPPLGRGEGGGEGVAPLSVTHRRCSGE